jgi:hypothetical protein
MTGQFRSSLHVLSGFFVHRSCGSAVNALATCGYAGLGERACPPHRWVAGRPAGALGPLRGSPRQSWCVSQPSSGPTPAHGGRPHPTRPRGPEEGRPGGIVPTTLGAMRDYNHRHLTGLPVRSRGPHTGIRVVVGRTRPAFLWGFFHAPAGRCSRPPPGRGLGARGGWQKPLSGCPR